MNRLIEKLLDKSLLIILKYKTGYSKTSLLNFSISIKYLYSEIIIIYI